MSEEDDQQIKAKDIDALFAGGHLDSRGDEEDDDNAGITKFESIIKKVEEPEDTTNKDTRFDFNGGQ